MPRAFPKTCQQPTHACGTKKKRTRFFKVIKLKKGNKSVNDQGIVTSHKTYRFIVRMCCCNQVGRMRLVSMLLLMASERGEEAST